MIVLHVWHIIYTRIWMAAPVALNADVFAMDVFGEERSTKVGPEDISTFENNNLGDLGLHLGHLTPPGRLEARVDKREHPVTKVHWPPRGLVHAERWVRPGGGPAAILKALDYAPDRSLAF